jgi:two-component system sensor histidine kinase DegS
MEIKDRETMIELLERERGRLARDIHDGPAQSLTNTSMRLEVIKRLIQSNKVSEAIHELERLQELLRMSVNDVRRMIFDLRPALLEVGVQKAIVQYAERFQQLFGLPVTVRGEWPDKSLGHTQEIALFRIFQEVLNNVHKHARATAVDVELYSNEDWVGFRVKDDGCGFDVANIESRSYGLKGMQERIALAGGRLKVSSNPGCGTCVECEVPVYHG